MTRQQAEAYLDALAARDAATPAWLLRLRAYIDAAIDHKLAMHEPGEDGYYRSDMGGDTQCETLWTEVVKALPPGPLVTRADEVRPYEMSLNAWRERHKSKE